MKIQYHILIFLFFSFCLTTSAQSETIRISTAASMTEAVKEIIISFEATSPNIKCLTNFASSGSLAKQIEQGAPTDIYISANTKWMVFLLQKQFISLDNNQIFAHNQLVFIGAGNTPIHSMDSVKNLDRIAMGNPMSVPAGKYAEQAMVNSGMYDILKKNKKLIFAKDVRQALLYADRGEVDGAFVYATDVPLAKNITMGFTIPQELYTRISYPVGLTVDGMKKEGAKKLYNFILGEKAAEILASYGFKPVNQQ